MPRLSQEPRLRTAVLIGSTRSGRAGAPIGEWFHASAGGHDGIAASVIDLASFDFPARHPAEAAGDTARFVAAIDRAEAFVVVTPEYNRSFPASLKQAIDYAYDEWHAKPVGFVSYGCDSRGMYAVEQLRTVFTELQTVTMRDVVSFDLLRGDLDAHGRPRGTATQRHAVTNLLDQLAWWGRALRVARAADPYVS